SIAAVIFVLGTVRTLMETPLYTAVTRIQIDRTAAKVVEAGNVQADMMDSDTLRTQIEILKCRTLSERVASSLKLGRDATFLEPTSFSIIGFLHGLASSPPAAGQRNEAAAEAAAAGVIMGRREIRPVPGARLVDIAYSDPDRARAQRV